jgi:hypothetical protein
MLPIAAHLARTATEELTRSALPGAPVRQQRASRPGHAASRSGRRRLAAALRSTADRLEPIAE